MDKNYNFVEFFIVYVSIQTKINFENFRFKDFPVILTTREFRFKLCDFRSKIEEKKVLKNMKFWHIKKFSIFSQRKF